MAKDRIVCSYFKKQEEYTQTFTNIHINTHTHTHTWASLVTYLVKNPTAMRETWV